MSGRTFYLGKLELRINWLIAACVVLSMAGLVRLGLWQLDRAQEKIALQESFQELGSQQATPIENVPVAGLEFDVLQHQNRRVVMQGRYLNQQNIFLIYQTYEEQLGYEIVTPFKVENLDLVVMVSRGWSGINDTQELAASLLPIEGQQTLQGQIYVPTPAQASRSSSLARVQWPLTIRYLNINELMPYFDSPLFPYVVRLGADQLGVLVRHWSEVMVDTGRNFSYALQWFAIAIALLIVSLILSSNILVLLRKK